MFDILVHKWLRIPYTLHATVRRVPNSRLTVLMIHGIGNSERVWDMVVERLPDTIQVVTIDLLGFGRSAQPDWADYDARTQARSVLATYLKLRLSGRVVIVGHSLGALVAIEVACRYPALVKGLVLCSPPLYHLDDSERKLLPTPDKVLTSIYKVLQKHPDEFLQLGKLAVRYRLITDAFEVTQENVAMYMTTLESAIINQTAMDDIRRLTCPIHILHGRFDPVVVPRNLSLLAETQPNIKLYHVASGHEVTGPMVSATVKSIEHFYQ